MASYSLAYYEGEERDVNLKGLIFLNIKNALQFISDNGLHYDYISITEWDECDDIICQENANYFLRRMQTIF